MGSRLLAAGGCAAAEAAAFTGGATVLEALTSQGMARILPHSPAKPAWLRPASPDLALQGVLAGHQGQAARHAELLLEAQHRLADAQARYGTPLNNEFPEHLVAVISDRDQISELTASLANTARQDWMTLENLATEMPLTADFAARPCPLPRAWSGAGRSTPPQRWTIPSPPASSASAPKPERKPGCCPRCP